MSTSSRRCAGPLADADRDPAFAAEALNHAVREAARSAIGRALRAEFAAAYRRPPGHGRS
jgi:hypothetical protein